MLRAGEYALLFNANTSVYGYHMPPDYTLQFNLLSYHRNQLDSETSRHSSMQDHKHEYPWNLARHDLLDRKWQAVVMWW